jgi:hypothetical protein
MKIKAINFILLLIIILIIVGVLYFIKSKKEIDNFFVTSPIIKFNVPQTSVIPDKYRYYKWEINKIRNATANMVQVSEFIFYDKDGNKISIPGTAVTNPNGNNPTNYDPNNAYWNQLPKNLVDNNVNNKWLDFNGPYNPPIKIGGTIIFDLTSISSVPIYYSWITGRDIPDRDPISWIIYGSDDKISWTKLHSVNDFNTPTNGLEHVIMPSLQGSTSTTPQPFTLTYPNKVIQSTPTFAPTIPNPMDYTGFDKNEKIGLFFLNPPAEITDSDGIVYGYRVTYDCDIKKENCKYDYKY